MPASRLTLRDRRLALRRRHFVGDDGERDRRIKPPARGNAADETTDEQQFGRSAPRRQGSGLAVCGLHRQILRMRILPWNGRRLGPTRVGRME